MAKAKTKTKPKKKNKQIPTLEPFEVWHFASFLLQCAYELEKNKDGLDKDSRKMLIKVQKVFKTLHKDVEVSFRRKFQVFLADQLAKIFWQVLDGELDAKNKKKYRRAIADNSDDYWDEKEDPNNPFSVPNFFLLSEETITEDGGASEAATKAIAEQFKLVSRTINLNRAFVKKGNLKKYGRPDLVNYRERISGFYKATMLNCFALHQELVEEVVGIIKKKMY